MEKSNLTIDKALAVMKVIESEGLYDGVIPDEERPKQAIELAQRFTDYAIAAIKDENALDVTRDIVRAAGIDFITMPDGNQFIIESSDIEEEEEELAPESGNTEERTEGKVAPREDAEALTSQSPTEEKKDDFVGSDWMKTLQASTASLNLPEPEALDADDIPRFPRDITSSTVTTAKLNKLMGQFNSALATANFQAAKAQVDAKNYKLLSSRKLSELEMAYRSAGENKTNAKEKAEIDSRYLEIEEKYLEQDAKKVYFEKLASIYSKNVDVISRSLTFRMEETK